MSPIESNIPTTKTSSSTKYMEALVYILNNLDPLLAHYGDTLYAEERLLNYSLTVITTNPSLAPLLFPCWHLVLKQAEMDGKLVIVPINEAYTSKVCRKCHTRNMINKTVDETSKLHSVLVCQCCNTVASRCQRCQQYSSPCYLYHGKQPSSRHFLSLGFSSSSNFNINIKFTLR
ncbi:hypothetical protein BC941DRAFT_474785 [Chlamydoabsidia padenii]|nr:hypothetical protein BC941DRAFT_474785 [Chlamydoabsidia padenii]